MKVRIVSDGKSSGSRVENAETGQLIHGVTRVDWWCEAGGTAYAVLRLRNVAVDVVATVEEAS